MTSLLEQVEQSIRTKRLFCAGDSILIGVSAGVDSMVLLHLLKSLAQKYRWRLTIAHLNHTLRGRSSLADARLVRRIGRELALPAVIQKADVLSLAKSQGLSVEMAARQARHAFFARTARRFGIRTIALGHHADDQLELFFLRLFRGSGSDGLTGMGWQSQSPAAPELRLARPLLEQPKAALEQYAAAKGIPFREDATNAELNIPRNRIRNELLPLLKTHYQPALERIIPRVVQIVSAEADFASQVATSWLRRRLKANSIRVPSSDKPQVPIRISASLDSHLFDDLPLAVQRRCVQLQLIQFGLIPDFDLTERLRTTPNCPVCARRASFSGHSDSPCDQVSHKETDNKGILRAKSPQLSVFRDTTGVVRLEKLPGVSFREGTRTFELIGEEGSVLFDGATIHWGIGASGSQSKLKTLQRCEVFDAEHVGEKILLRHWRPGDRFRPIGMKNAVKLQDLFTNQKVSRDERYTRLLAVAGSGEIFWVEGQRISERFKITDATNRVLRWRWERL